MEGEREGGRVKTAEYYKLSTTRLTQCFPVLFALLHGSSMTPAQKERSSLHRDERPLAPQRQQDNKLSVSLLCLLTWRGSVHGKRGSQSEPSRPRSGVQEPFIDSEILAGRADLQMQINEW